MFPQNWYIMMCVFWKKTKNSKEKKLIEVEIHEKLYGIEN